jgi:uncharacterized SAM-binding protein YcdF (DUF218 family)
MSPREKYIAVIANEVLPATVDALVVLEGDLFERNKEAARLYRAGAAPLVVLSGGDVAKLHYARPAREMKQNLVRLGVPASAIVCEGKSQDTREQAEEVIRIAKDFGWNRFAIIASHYHQYRAYLTFLKALQEQGLERKIVLYNAPARGPKWFEATARGTRIDLLNEEMKRIDTYRKEYGHIATFEDALAYQEWKESQR